jgi:hypothetical protein
MGINLRNLPNLWKKRQIFSLPLSAVDGTDSLNLNTRQLVDENGGATIKWNVADTVLLSGGQPRVNWGTGKLFDSGGIDVVNWEGLQLVNEANHVVVDWDNAFLVRDGGAITLAWGTCNAYSIDTNISIDWDLRQLYSVDGSTAIDWQNRVFLNTSGNETANWEAQNLSATDGTFSLNWQTRELFNAGATTVGNWDASQLYGNEGEESIDWNNRFLISDLGQATVDWSSTYLIDAGDLVAVDWQNRKLVKPDGTAALDWSGNFASFMGGKAAISPAGNITDAGMVGQTLYVTDAPFNAKCDGRQVGNAATTAGSNVVTSASLAATAADIGKSVVIYKAGAAGATFKSTITAVTNPTTIVLAANTPSTTAGTLMVVATDDTNAIQAAINTLVNLCRTTRYKSGTLILPDSGIIYCGGPLQDAGFANSVLKIPNIRKQDDGNPAITITIKPRGPWTDTQYWGFSQEPPHLTGPVLLFGATGSGTNPSCIGSTPDSWTTDAGPSPCGTVALNIDNVTIRQLDPASMHALNWYTAGDLNVGTICCDTFCRITDLAAPVFGCGVRFPANGASATYIGHNVQVFRHDRGIEIANQSDIRHAFINFCRAAVVVHAFASSIGARLGFTLIQRCSKLVETVYDAGAGWTFCLSWDWLQTENSAADDAMVWTRPALTGQIDDPGWALIGQIKTVMNFTGGLPTRNGAVNLWMFNLLTNETQGGGRAPLKFTNITPGGSMTTVYDDASGGNNVGVSYQWGGVGKYAVAIDDRYGGAQAVVSEYNAVTASFDRTYELTNRIPRWRYNDYTGAASWWPWIDDATFNGWMAGPYVRDGYLTWKLRDTGGNLKYPKIALAPRRVLASQLGIILDGNLSNTSVGTDQTAAIEAAIAATYAAMGPFTLVIDGVLYAHDVRMRTGMGLEGLGTQTGIVESPGGTCAIRNLNWKSSHDEAADPGRTNPNARLADPYSAIVDRHLSIKNMTINGNQRLASGNTNRGGLWDLNAPETPSWMKMTTSGQFISPIQLYGVEYVEISNVRVVDPCYVCIHCSTIRYFYFHDLTLDDTFHHTPINGPNTAGVQIEGPGSHGFIENQICWMSDDAWAFNAWSWNMKTSGVAPGDVFGPQTFGNWGIVFNGPIFDITCKNLKLVSGYNVVRLMSGANLIDKMLFDNITGTAAGGLAETDSTSLAGFGDGNGNLGDIAFTNIALERVRGQNGPVPWVNLACKIRTIRFAGIHKETIDSQWDGAFFAQLNCNIGTLIIDNWQINEQDVTDPRGTIPDDREIYLVRQGAGNIDTLVLNNVHWKRSTNTIANDPYGGTTVRTLIDGALVETNGGTIGAIFLNNVHVDRVKNVVLLLSGAGVGAIHVNGLRHTNASPYAAIKVGASAPVSGAVTLPEFTSTGTSAPLLIDSSFAGSSVTRMVTNKPQNYPAVEVEMPLHPVLCLPLTETTGTTATDLRRLQNGAYVGGFTLGDQKGVTDYEQRSVLLNGTSGAVTVASQAALKLPAAFSIECLVRPTANTGSVQMIVFKGTGATVRNYDLDINGAFPRLFVTQGGGGTFVGFQSATGINFGKWNHLLGVYDGANLILYMNGVNVGSTACSGNVDTSDDVLAIGKQGGDNSFWFGGNVGYMAVYNVALSADQAWKNSARLLAGRQT